MNTKQLNEELDKILNEKMKNIRYNGNEYWISSFSSLDNFDDESGAGGIWDLAGDFLENNNAYSEELQEALYNLIKYDILKI